MPRSARLSKRSRDAADHPPDRRAWRWLGWIAAGLFALLLLALAFGYARMRSWIKGSEFRELVEQRVGELAHAEVKLEPLEWDGWEAYSERMTLTGEAKAGFETSGLEGLRVSARPAGVWRGAWELPNVQIDSVTLHYRLGESKVEASSAPPPTTGAADEHPDEAGGGLLPGRVEVGLLDVSRLDVLPADGDGPEVRGLRLQVEGDEAGDRYLARAEGGTVALPLLPDFSLRVLEARASQDSINVLDARLYRIGGGLLELRGRLGLAEEVPTDIQLMLTQLPLKTLLAEDWRQRLEGTAQASLAWRSAEGRNWLEGPVSVDGAQVTLLPVLDRLARYFEDSRLRQINFETARAEVSWEEGRLELREIFLHSRGLLRIEGEIRIEADGQLDGLLQFGVVPALLAGLPRAEQELFAERREGLRWTPVQLGGRVDEIEEDLSGRIIAAAAERMLDWLPEPLREQARTGGEVVIGGLSLLGGASETESGRPTSSGSLAEQGAGLGAGLIEGGRTVVEDPAGGLEEAREAVGTLLDGAVGEGTATEGGSELIERGAEVLEQGGGLLDNLLGGGRAATPERASPATGAGADPEAETEPDPETGPEPDPEAETGSDPETGTETDEPGADTDQEGGDPPGTGQDDVPADDADADDLFRY